MPMEQFVELEKAYERSIKDNTETGRVTLGCNVWVKWHRAWMRIHKKEDAYLILCHSTPFLEVYHNHFVVIAPPPDSLHYTNQMNLICSAIIPAGKNRRRYYIQRRWNDRLAMRVCSFGRMSLTSRFIDHCMVNAEGKVIYTDFDKAVVEVDEERVMVMRRKIRNYFKPYEVLIRIQSVEDKIKQMFERSHRNNVEDLSHRLGIQPSAHGFLDGINEHIASGEIMNTEFTTLVAIVGDGAYRYGVTRYKGHQAFLDRIKKVKALLRLRFSQGCTKVMYEKYIPEDAYAQYQSLVIQQIDGLRSLPVPSQAEISRSHPGAVAPTSGRQA